MAGQQPAGRRCLSAGRVSAKLLLAFFALSPLPLVSAASFDRIPDQQPLLLPDNPENGQVDAFDDQPFQLELRQIFHHGVSKYQDLHRRLDVSPNTQLWIEGDNSVTLQPPPVVTVKRQRAKLRRLRNRTPAFINSILDTGRMTGKPVDLPSIAWTVDDVASPAITDKETILSLAKIAANAYVKVPDTGDWLDVGHGYNSTKDFGWESQGLRGHIFADPKNQTVVIGLKGTSPAVFDGSETTGNDKINDNLFFGCCCGLPTSSILLRPACQCYTPDYTCNSTCVVEALRDKNHYYYAVQELYHNVTAIYPNSDVWLVGHSLGGALSSLLGQTVGRIAVTFEAVPEAMAAKRLGLPVAPEYQLGAADQVFSNGVWHFGNDADPVFTGTCNTIWDSCTYGGYAMQSKCHTGMRCVYPVRDDNGTTPGIAHHRILEVIHRVIEAYADVPTCKPIGDCQDCSDYTFFDSNSTNITTTLSSTSTYHRTRTETCKTPGWWGCLDEPATTTESTSSSSSSSTSTCKTPGWFGCLDEITTSSSTTTTTATTTTTTTCETPGWFGCNDKTTTTSTTSSHASTPRMTTSPTCKTPGWFGKCRDAKPSPTKTSAMSTITSPPTRPSPSHTKHHKTKTASKTCTSKAWFGFICLDPSPTSDPW